MNGSLHAAALSATLLLTTPAFAQTTQPATAPATMPAFGPALDFDADAEPALDALDPAGVAALAEEAARSLVVVKYTWASEDARRELEGQGLVVGADGLVMFPLDLVPIQLPDAQLVEFELRLPRRDGDPTEVAATLVGRDERSGVAFVRPAVDAGEPVEWTPFAIATPRFVVGQPLVTVGRLPEEAGYTPYARGVRVSAELRGPVPSVLVDAPMANVGSAVLDTDGRLVGIVDRYGRTSPFLTGLSSVDVVEGAPHLFVPAWFLAPSLAQPPIMGDPPVSFSGIARMTGLNEDLRGYYGLGDRPAAQVNDLLPDSPAVAAGIQEGDVLVALNGEPLERGDTDDEQPAIINRTLSRYQVGETVTFTLLNAAREERDVDVVLVERPKPVRAAERWYAEDLGFSVRELVTQDTYQRKLPSDTPGVAVAYIREQSNAAAAGVQPNDLVRRVNQAAVEGLADFQRIYEAAREETPDAPIVLEVLRGPETQVIRIEASQN